MIVKHYSIIILCILIAFLSHAKTPDMICESSVDSTFPKGDGSDTSPYVICNEKQFNRLNSEDALLDKDFKLGSNISFTKDTHKIGTYAKPFTGEFDGAHYTLSSLNIIKKEGGGISNMGLFSHIKNARICNLYLDGITIPDGGNNVGTLAGYSTHSMILNVHVRHIDMFAPDHSGGLIGQAEYSTLFNCSAQGILKNHFGTNGSGGLLGIGYYTDVKHSFSDVVINNDSANPWGVSEIGGLIGFIYFGEVSDVYAAGAIDYRSTRGGPKLVGGLIGNAARSKIDRAYAAVKLNITAIYKGGAIGYGASSTNNNVYWDAELASIQFSDGGEPLDTLTMQTPDFWLNQAFDPTQWIFVKGEYPKLHTKCDSTSKHC